jgi:hypothetical protein
MQYCSKCLYPFVAATPLAFDEELICSGCRVDAAKAEIDWDERRQMLDELVDEYRSTSDYDVVIPAGGGKDSYYQAHFAIKELGLEALLVTYHGNNFLPE